MYTLGILIATLKEEQRRTFLARLMKDLQPQVDAHADRVRVYMLEDGGQQTTGAKRQALVEMADAEFVCHVDDDDRVSATYVADILAAIDKGADVVGFRVRYYEDGVLAGYSVHSTAVEWGEQRQENGFVHYTRTPNHLNPVRKRFALETGFKPITHGEDSDYSRRLYEKFPQMKEVFIDKFLYQYFFRTQRPKVLIKMYDEDGRMTREGMEETIRKGGSVMVGGMVCTRVEQLPA